MNLYELFWNEQFWLKDNYTWRDIDAANEREYVGRPRDLFYSFLTAFFLYIIRYILERKVWRNIGLFFGLTEKKFKCPSENPDLEVEFKRNKRPSNDRVHQLSKQTDQSEISIHRWFRVRRNFTKSDYLTKFGESGWRFTFYLFSFLSGMWVLSDQEFVYDTKLMWSNVPYNHVTPVMFWFIMIELGYYWSSLITVFSDVKRTDFLTMFIHHLVTISLIALAWVQNYIPVTLYIIVIHDSVDWIMEGAKLLRYLNRTIICIYLFIIFALWWFLSRNVFYPYVIIYSCLTQLEATNGATRICQVFIVVLEFLHIIWFGLIIRIAIITLDKDQEIHDSRSDSEISESSDTESKNGIDNKKSK